jgi:hypothetical protein
MMLDEEGSFDHVIWQYNNKKEPSMAKGKILAIVSQSRALTGLTPGPELQATSD